MNYVHIEIYKHIGIALLNAVVKMLRFVTLMDRLTEYMLDPAASRDVSKPKVKLPIFL